MRQKMHAFDTYSHVNALKEAGFNEKQASVIIKSLMESRETDISHLATKDQITKLESFTKVQVSFLDNKIDKLTSRVENIERNMATKEDLAEIKALIADTYASTLKWMIATMIAFSGILLAGIKYL